MTDTPPLHRCPICGSSADQLAPWLNISRDVKSGRPISTGTLVWCKTCDLGLMRRLPTDAEIAESYDLGEYYTHGATHFPTVRANLADRILLKLAYLRDHGRLIERGELLAQNPGAKRVLDIGCGNGELLASLAGDGRRLTGVEPDPQARALAATHGIEVLAGTAEHLPREVQAEHFDLILLSHVLEHCRDPVLALGNIRDRLAAGGVLYCEVPNCGAAHFRTFAQISEMLDVPRHIHFFTRAALTRLCEKAGLEVLDWRYHGFTRHFGVGWRAWENQIHTLLSADAGGVGVPRRTWISSYELLMKSAFARADRKYDCIGFFARAQR